MGGYPPGTSRRDLIRGGIIEPHDHEHEWEMDDHRADPIIEDGAAIFHLQCRYAEGRYGEKWSCEEEKSYRFDYDSLVFPNDSSCPIRDIDHWKKNTDFVRRKVVEIESAWHAGDEDVTIYVDPDPGYGEVVIEWQGWELRYTA